MNKDDFFSEMCHSQTVSNISSFYSLPSLFVSIFLKIQCDRYGESVKYRFLIFNTHENECGMNGHLLIPHERTLTLAFSLGLCRMEHLSNLM